MVWPVQERVKLNEERGLANTPEQDQAAFEKVVAQNPDFTPVLQRIHQTGKVTQDGREAFYKAVSQTK